MFEAIEFVERRLVPDPIERHLGQYSDELEAVEAARDARAAFAESESDDYAWWIVRQVGLRLALFIADSKTDKEFVLDLTSGNLVEV